MLYTLIRRKMMNHVRPMKFLTGEMYAELENVLFHVSLFILSDLSKPSCC